MMNLITSHGARATVKTWKRDAAQSHGLPLWGRKEHSESRQRHPVFIIRCICQGFIHLIGRMIVRTGVTSTSSLSAARVLVSSLRPFISLIFFTLSVTLRPPVSSLSLSHSLAVFFALLFLLIFPHCWQTSAPTAKYYNGSSRRPAWRLSPALPRAPYCTFQEQRDPCLNSGKNKRQLMRPHYVNALCSLELWPQPKMTWANYGQ